MGADGVNPIQFLILVGDADRQWLEARYFDPSIQPLGNLKFLVPAGPNHPDALLDACLAFYPEHFAKCRSMAKVKAALGETERLDFHLDPKGIPPDWAKLRKEARKRFAELNLWTADLVPLGSAV